MTAAAQPEGQPPASYADPAAVDAWRLIVIRLRGEPSDGFETLSGSPGRVLGWAVEIAAAGMAAREHDLGASWEGAFAAARRTAESRLEAAKTAPDVRVLAQLAGGFGLRRAPRTGGPARRGRGRR